MEATKPSTPKDTDFRLLALIFGLFALATGVLGYAICLLNRFDPEQPSLTDLNVVATAMAVMSTLFTSCVFLFSGHQPLNRFRVAWRIWWVSGTVLASGLAFYATYLLLFNQHAPAALAVPLSFVTYFGGMYLCAAAFASIKRQADQQEEQ